jgi:anti-sigma regulatory factor (Ser/Thr protein kinase)
MAQVAGDVSPPDDAGGDDRRHARHDERGRSVNVPDAAARTYVSSNVLRVRHEPSAVGGARRQVRRELAAEHLPEPLLDDVEVVLSELMGNAVRHARPIAGGVLLVGWRIADDELTLRVTDGGSIKRVEPRESGPMSDSGRGLHIVERLVNAWGVTDHAGSLRTVWAVLPVHERPVTLRLVRS